MNVCVFIALCLYCLWCLLDWIIGTRGDAELVVDINCELLNVKAGERSKLYPSMMFIPFIHIIDLSIDFTSLHVMIASYRGSCKHPFTG